MKLHAKKLLDEINEYKRKQFILNNACIKRKNGSYVFMSNDGSEHSLTKMEILMYSINVINILQLESQYNTNNQKG